MGDDDVPDSVWEEIFNEADSLLTKYLTQGLNVANEYAWITRTWRDRARSVATKLGIETKVIYIKISTDTIKKRWKDNEATKVRFQWPEKELQDILHDFEEPTVDENIIIYDQSIPVTDWIKQNISLYLPRRQAGRSRSKI